MPFAPPIFRQRIPLLGGMPPYVIRGGRLEVFVAYPYHFDDFGYRAMLHDMEQAARIRIRLADDDPSAAHIATKVLTRLRRCTVAIFDLSEWNPNVAFEFGMCEGLTHGDRRNVWLLLDNTKTQGVPSDMQGLAQLRYANLDELRGLLTRHLTERFPLPRPRF